jgi:hypothetical protein
MRRVRQYRSYGVGRSLTLLRALLLASAAILAIGAVALSSTLSDDLRAAALDDTALDVGAYADAVVAPALVRSGEIAASPAARRRLARSIRLPADVRGLNAYARDGRLVFSTTRPNRVGRRRSSPDLRETVESGAPSAALVDEAMVQIHAGLGKQFNPAVVDAFLSVAERRPAEIMPAGAPSSAAVAV